MSEAISQQNWRQRIYGWLYEHLETFSWLALCMFASLLIVMAAGLWIASKQRTVVVLRNDSGQAIHDVQLKPAAASSREPRHFVPHIENGHAESFVTYPLRECPVILQFLDGDGRPHHWEGARVGPKTRKTLLRITPDDAVAS